MTDLGTPLQQSVVVYIQQPSLVHLKAELNLGKRQATAWPSPLLPDFFISTWSQLNVPTFLPGPDLPPILCLPSEPAVTPGFSFYLDLSPILFVLLAHINSEQLVQHLFGFGAEHQHLHLGPWDWDCCKWEKIMRCFEWLQNPDYPVDMQDFFIFKAPWRLFNSC